MIDLSEGQGFGTDEVLALRVGSDDDAASGPRGWIGGAEEDRTPDLRIANATLSQLSYGPIMNFSKDRDDTP